MSDAGASSGAAAPATQATTPAATTGATATNGAKPGPADLPPGTSEAVKQVYKAKFKALDDSLNEVDAEEAFELDHLDDKEVKMSRKEFERMVRLVNNDKTSTTRFKKGGELSRRAESALRALADPNEFWEVARRLGHDPDKMSEARVTELLRREMMDPRERELHDSKRELEQLRAERELMQQRQQQAHMERATEHARTQYLAQMTPALKSAGVPPAPKAIERMAGVMRQAMEDGYDISVAEAAHIVRQEYDAELREIMSAGDASQILGLVGDDVAARIRTADLARIQKGPPPAQPQRQANHNQEAPRPKKRWDDIFGK